MSKAEEWLESREIFCGPDHREALKRGCRCDLCEYVRKYGDLRAEEAAEPLRRRLFVQRQVKGASHSTSCSIWGDDGRGNTKEGFPQPLPCNCGALINWSREEAKAELLEEWRVTDVEKWLVENGHLCRAEDGCPQCNKTRQALAMAKAQGSKR